MHPLTPPSLALNTHTHGCVQALYHQPVVNTAAHSGMDLGATLGVVAGGVAGYLGYELRKQVRTRACVWLPGS
jgi:hypothetical protein